MHSLIRLILGFAFWLAATCAIAAVPAGYVFKPVAQTVPDGTFKTAFNDRRQLSAATAVEDNGFVYGFWMTDTRAFNAFSVQFGSNPAFRSRKLENFVTLSGSNVPMDFACLFGFCKDFGFGIRVTPSTVAGTPPSGVSAFMNTPTDQAAIAGSLPFAMFPGSFVEENGPGVLASTQVRPDGTQYGVLMRDDTAVELPDVPWLIGINDLSDPLVIGYDGEDAGCFVFGTNCVYDPADDCVHDEDDDHHGDGVGHEEHGQGYGWGHERCEDLTGTAPAAMAVARAGLQPVPRAAVAATGALLLRLNPDNSVERLRFPAVARIDGADVPVAHVFPLAINGDRVILRGDVTVNDTLLAKRLLSCSVNANALDADSDGVVDCVDGIQVPGGAAGSVRVGTVLGFTLSNAGVLAGNLGYNLAGIGTPFLIDVTAADPAPKILANLSTGHSTWEINTLTDMNQSGKISGYGYRDCSAWPEAFFLDPADTGPASPLVFARGAFESPAALVSGSTLKIQPSLSGGSGLYEIRVHARRPSDSAWTMLADWTSSPPTWNPGAYTGQVCFRIEARDVVAPDIRSEEIVRYTVVSRDTAIREGIAATDTGAGDVTLSSENVDLGALLGPVSPGWLFVALAAMLRRRRA